MNHPEADSTPPLTRWHPFMCPGCRGLFRAPSGRNGPAQCPLCHQALNITTPDLSTGASAPEQNRRRRKKSSPQVREWGEEPQENHRRKDSRKSWTSLFVICALSAFFVGLLGFVILRPIFQEANKSDPAKASALKDQYFSQSSEDTFTPPSVDFTVDDSELAVDAVRKFLEAETLEELALHIRHSETLMPVIRDYYQGTDYQATNFKNINEDGTVQISQEFASVVVVMGDYSKRPIAVEFTEQGPLVDWESWVGYCELPWEKIVADQTTQPTLVRVSVRESHYFNFDFVDDSQWACFQLQHNNSEKTLYGYCSAEAPFLQKLPSRIKKVGAYVLKIKFPENPRTDDQVIITDFICDGWVPDLQAR